MQAGAFALGGRGSCAWVEKVALKAQAFGRKQGQNTCMPKLPGREKPTCICSKSLHPEQAKKKGIPKFQASPGVENSRHHLSGWGHQNHSLKLWQGRG